MEELARTVDDGFTTDEVRQAKRTLIGEHRMALQSVSGMSARVALDELYGLGYDAWSTYEATIDAVMPQQVHEAA